MEASPSSDPEPLGGASDPLASDRLPDGDPVRHRGLVPRALLDEQALSVVRRLRRFGHEAYFVGGCVRDLIAGHEPKDFDVATDARPARIKRLFRNARIIGRRFRLAHIRFGEHVVETATFRGDPVAEVEAQSSDLSGRGVENVFGTAPEDARRRDFTVNALFYDPLENEVVDWVGGLADLEDRVVRSIGDPHRRIVEDPVRMIRAVHIAERLGFRLEEGLEAAIANGADELCRASQARLYIELMKVLGRGAARPTLRRLAKAGVLAVWLPELDAHLRDPDAWPPSGATASDGDSPGEPDDLPVAHLTWNLLGAADRWGMAAHGASDALTLAPLVGAWLADAWKRSGRRGFAAFGEVTGETFRPLALRMSIPRRTTARLRDALWMWLAMRRGPPRSENPRMVRRVAFPDAVDLLRLDLMARDRPEDLLDAWSALLPPPRAPRAPRERSPRGARGRRRRRGPVGEEAAAWAPPPPLAGEEAMGSPPRRGPRRRRRRRGGR